MTPAPRPTAARRRPALCGLAAAVLTACAAEPPAAVATPADAGIAAPAAYTAQPAAAPGAPLDADGWWQTFGDRQLDALVEAALQQNRDLQAAAARLLAAAEDATIAGAARLPEVDAAFDPARSRRVFVGFPFGSGGGVPNNTFTQYGLSLSLRWELDVWGRLRAGEAAALADVQAAAADLAGARLSLLAQTCKAYFAAVAARQQLELARATAASMQATADDVRDRFRRGVRPALDVHQAATNQQNAEAAAAARADELQRALRRLDVLAGRYPDGRAAAALALPAELPALPAGIPGELLQRRPDLVATERRLAAAGCRVDAARAALYPRLSLTASGGTSSDALEDLVDVDYRVWSLGANLLQPLFRGGALRADVRRREARVAAAVAEYGGALLQAFAEVEQALAAEAQLTAQRAALAGAARHAAAARDLARERWQRGVGDFLAVADGQRQAFAAESARIAADAARLQNRIDLILALGGGYTAAAPAGARP